MCIIAFARLFFLCVIIFSLFQEWGENQGESWVNMISIDWISGLFVFTSTTGEEMVRRRAEVLLGRWVAFKVRSFSLLFENSTINTCRYTGKNIVHQNNRWHSAEWDSVGWKIAMGWFGCTLLQFYNVKVVQCVLDIDLKKAKHFFNQSYLMFWKITHVPFIANK